MKPPIPIGGDCPLHQHRDAQHTRTLDGELPPRIEASFPQCASGEPAECHSLEKTKGLINTTNIWANTKKRTISPPMTRPVHDKMLFRWRRIPKPETASEKGNTPPRKIVTRNMWGCPCPLSYQNTEENAKRQRPFSRKPNHPRIPAKTLRARWECSHRLAPESKRYPPSEWSLIFRSRFPSCSKGLLFLLQPSLLAPGFKEHDPTQEQFDDRSRCIAVPFR